jgi:serine/threonine protein kinase
MAFCTECGKDIFDEAKFCPNCGTPQMTVEVSDPGNSNTLKANVSKLYGAVNLDRLPEGYVINDRYEVKEKLGQGGFAAVYRVYDRNVETDKALKVFIDAFSNDKEAVEDLRREGKIMMNLTHERIVRIFDVHTTGSIKYIDMEYVDGKSLAEYKLTFPDRKVPEETVLELGKKIAEGLSYAHGKRVIHKDLKPQNILVKEDGEIKITDFGISDCIRSSMSRVANTTSSGTLLYMAPEQIKGEDVGKEADIYSFGVLMYELLSGNPPFYRGAVEYQIFNEQPAILSHVSKDLNDIIIRCLEKEYGRRYGDGKEMKAALDNDDYISIRKPETLDFSTGFSKLRLDRGNIKILLPVSAEVYIDGENVGLLEGGSENTFQDIEVGIREIEVRYINGQIERQRVRIKKGHTEQIKFELGFGSIRIELGENQAGGILFLDDKELGKIDTGQSATIEAIQKGMYECELRCNQGESLKQIISVESEKTSEIFFPCREVYSIGPAGGIIFYDKGSISDGWRFLEAAPQETEWQNMPWGMLNKLVGCTEEAIGTGASNTTSIVRINGKINYDYAAKLCNDLVYNGFDDWFLPSLGEINLMRDTLLKKGLGSFAQENYWSSSEYDNNIAWVQRFFSINLNKDRYNCTKHFTCRVRAIRAF